MTQIFTLALKALKYIIYLFLILYFFSFLVLALEVIVEIEALNKYTILSFLFALSTITYLVSTFLFQRIIMANSFFKSIALSTLTYLMFFLISFIIFNINYEQTFNDEQSKASFKSVFLDYKEILNINKLRVPEEITNTQLAFIEFEKYFLIIFLLCILAEGYFLYKKRENIKLTTVFFKLNINN